MLFRSVDVDDIIEKYSDKIKYFYYEENKGVFGRFESVSSIDTEYVFIIDDDRLIFERGTWLGALVEQGTVFYLKKENKETN